MFSDHKPLLYFWARKRRFFHQLLPYQVIITQFNNLRIIWTPEKNLTFPYLLSRNVSFKDVNSHQLAPKNLKIFPRISDASTTADMMFNMSLTKRAPLMMKVTIFNPFVEHIWVKQRHFTLELMVLTWFVQVLAQYQLKLFRFFGFFPRRQDH